MNQSSNPALSNKAFSRYEVVGAADTMTAGGTMAKVGISLLVLIAAAAYGWYLVPQLGVTIPFWTLWAGAIAAVVVGFVAVFKANWFTVLLYSLLEGLYIGVISRFFATAYDGIVTQAILATLGVTAAAYFLYAAGLVKVTKKFYSVVLIATVGVAIYLLAEFIISLFVPSFLTFVTSGTSGIIIAAVIVLIAALNLFLDFNTISKGVENKLSKKAEWYAAFGLMVTLIWLYVSILRLLGASRR